jgi:hypothetical protein
MVDKALFEELKQTNVSKDAGKTKVRLREIWKDLEVSKRAEIMDLSGLKKFTVERSYKNGNISAKLALAVAHVLEINPNFLTGASDDREGYSDEIIRKFLTDNNYGKLLERITKPPKRPYNRKKPIEKPTDDNTTAVHLAAPEETVVEPPAPAEPPAPTEPSSSPYDLLLSRIQDKVRSITDDELAKIESLPEDAAEQLLKGLYLRIDYSEDAKNLAALIKLMLTM